MELDELKSAWAQYDKKLTENLKLNEEVLRKMNLNNSKKEMQKPMLYEIIGCIVMFIFLAYVISTSLKFIAEPKYCIPGVLSALVGLVYLIFAIIKTNNFINIDYYNSPILKLQKQIELVNRLVIKLRKIELSLIPLLIIPLLPILFKSIHNIDIYQNIRLLLIDTVLILVIGYFSTAWINRNVYDKKFKNTEYFLEEIKKFEEEY